MSTLFMVLDGNRCFHRSRSPLLLVLVLLAGAVVTVVSTVVVKQRSNLVTILYKTISNSRTNLALMAVTWFLRRPFLSYLLTLEQVQIFLKIQQRPIEASLWVFLTSIHRLLVPVHKFQIRLPEAANCRRQQI